MSIVRIGLAETKNFSEGYDAIFGKKGGAAAKNDADPKAKTPKEDAKKSPKNKKK